jgi:hypothetical protein
VSATGVAPLHVPEPEPVLAPEPELALACVDVAVVPDVDREPVPPDAPCALSPHPMAAP